MSANVQTESRLVATNHGYDIASTFFHSGGAVRGSILIAPAMGVRQRFYAPLATWLASRGFLVATFDYFGIGLSRKTDLASVDTSITDWARHDCEAMIVALVKDSPEKPLYWIGHSLGGQILGLVPNRDRISKMITIACGSGYWLENPLGLRLKVWWLWYVAAPLSIRMLGYFPGKRLRKVGDLPRGVMQQWRRWCLDRDYAVGAEGPEVAAQYAAVRVPITSISFADDEFMSLKNTQSLHGYYHSAPRRMKRIAPADVGVSRIGHFGFFDSRFQESLWQAHLLPELV
jgi:predicted alpha/beta hydrolase